MVRQEAWQKYSILWKDDNINVRRYIKQNLIRLMYKSDFVLTSNIWNDYQKLDDIFIQMLKTGTYTYLKKFS